MSKLEIGCWKTAYWTVLLRFYWQHKAMHYKVSFAIGFLLRDFWIGCYADKVSFSQPVCLWICVIPCVPLRIHVTRSAASYGK